MSGGVRRPVAHESAHLHVSGEAAYADDLPQPDGMLFVAPGLSPIAHGRITRMNLEPVLAADGVVAVLTAADIPGENNHGPILPDDPILAEGVVEYVGQVVFAVVATTVRQARAAARLADIDYEPLEAMLDIDACLDADADVLPPQTLARGEPAAVLEGARHRLSGAFTIGGQEHFYLEGQIAIAQPVEDGAMAVVSSTQHPTEVQHLVAGCLGLISSQVTVTCRRMGGGFGGKETQPALIACLAALAAHRTGRSVKMRLDRDEDFHITGKRHPYRVDYDVGFDDDGVIQAVDFRFASDCGRSADLSGPVNARTIFHADNCYYLDAARIESRRLKTHKASNTAFRGFGGPQGMMGIEYVIDEIARFLSLDPLDVRKRNLYGTGDRDTTPYRMRVEDNIAPRLVDELEASADYRARRRAIEAFNATSPVIKRGIALTPVKFGISFTARHYNQAGALIHIYRDGSILLNHGGTEMGQGLYTKVAQVVAEALRVNPARIRCSAADTSKVPNTSATAASAGSDLNGMAALDAAQKLKFRLEAFAAAHFGVDVSEVRFDNDAVTVGDRTLGFGELTDLAYCGRVSLSATGYYRTPKIDYDPETLIGRPFYYFCYGAAVAEVALDTLTGETRLTRVDILHDVGKSLNPAIDIGQIEGGFMQGVGWLTSEELCWDDSGRLATHAPSTYKIPTAADWPEDFHVAIADWSENRERTIYRSKGVGEPPFMLAMSVFFAIKDAVAASGDGDAGIVLNAPATPESVLRSVMAAGERRETRMAAHASATGQGSAT